MPSSATGVGMPICLLGGVLLILTQKNSQKFGDVLGIMVCRDSLKIWTFVRNPKELDIWSNDYFLQLAKMIQFG